LTSLRVWATREAFWPTISGGWLCLDIYRDTGRSRGAIKADLLIEVMILLGRFAVHLWAFVRAFVLTDHVEVTVFASATVVFADVGQC